MILDKTTDITDPENTNVTVSLRAVARSNSVSIFVRNTGRDAAELYERLNGKKMIVRSPDGFVSGGTLQVFPAESFAARLQSRLEKISSKTVPLGPGVIEQVRTWLGENEAYLKSIAGAGKPMANGQAAAQHPAEAGHIVRDDNNRALSLHVDRGAGTVTVFARDFNLRPDVAHLRITRQSLRNDEPVPHHGFFEFGKITRGPGVDIGTELQNIVGQLRGRQVNFSQQFVTNIGQWAKNNAEAFAFMNTGEVVALPAASREPELPPIAAKRNPFSGSIEGNEIKDNAGELVLRLIIKTGKREVSVFVKDPTQDAGDAQMQLHPGQGGRVPADGFIHVGEILLHAHTDVAGKIAEKISDLRRKGFNASDDLPEQAAAWVEANQDELTPLMTGEAASHGRDKRQGHGGGRSWR